MEIFQTDIFGNRQNTGLDPNKKDKKQDNPSKKTREYRDVTLNDGLLDEKNIEGDAMLILRILQRKMLYSGLSSIKSGKIFRNIVANEMSIKLGDTDSITAVRSSLVEYFLNK